MKKLNVRHALALSFCLSLFSFASYAQPEAKTDTLHIPKNVKVILDNSCFGCHNTDSRNDDAKEELDLKTLPQLSGTKRLVALKHIGEVIEENEMPPEKFLERKPEKALTDKQKETLIDWVKQESTSLLSK
ncbi:heme-binding domain-containing protein [Sunxiuqinia sp. sy24]|uniref:heme-binding domain-containing protein n=1 Tax=Sunxiuqinia sp. sy24 TaxID=3461495 RepID=UPI004045CFD2